MMMMMMMKILIITITITSSESTVSFFQQYLFPCPPERMVTKILKKESMSPTSLSYVVHLALSPAPPTILTQVGVHLVSEILR